MDGSRALICRAKRVGHLIDRGNCDRRGVTSCPKSESGVRIRRRREGIDLDVSTLADWVGAAAATLMPLVDAIQTHVFAAERIHADDTTVPVLAKGKTRTGRL